MPEVFGSFSRTDPSYLAVCFTWPQVALTHHVFHSCLYACHCMSVKQGEKCRRFGFAWQAGWRRSTAGCKRCCISAMPSDVRRVFDLPSCIIMLSGYARLLVPNLERYSCALHLNSSEGPPACLSVGCVISKV